jgi:hypothetical protein
MEWWEGAFDFFPIFSTIQECGFQNNYLIFKRIIQEQRNVAPCALHP